MLELLSKEQQNCAFGNTFKCKECTHFQIKKEETKEYDLYKKSMYHYIKPNVFMTIPDREKLRNEFETLNNKPTQFEKEEKYYCRRT